VLKTHSAAYESVISVIENGELSGCIEVTCLAEKIINDDCYRHALIYANSVFDCPDIYVNLQEEVDSGKIRLMISDFYVFGIDYMLNVHDETANFIRQAMGLISYVFISLMLPIDYADMYLNGWSLQQETLDVLEKLNLIGDIDNLSDALLYLEENEDKFDDTFELDADALKEAIQCRNIAKEDISCWSGFTNSPGFCFEYIDSLESFLVDKDLSNNEYGWLYLVVHAFRNSFSNEDELNELVRFRNEHVQGASMNLIVCLTNAELYSESVIQPIYEGCMDGGDDNEWVINVTTADSFSLAKKYINLLGVGAGLIKASWIKNDSLTD
jgi:hypothetical protein